MFGHANLATYGAHFIFEEQAQRLAELEVHLFGKAANVVVALDSGAGD
jgi:hypothetical protein